MALSRAQEKKRVRYALLLKTNRTPSVHKGEFPNMRLVKGLLLVSVFGYQYFNVYLGQKLCAFFQVVNCEVFFLLSDGE